MTNMIQKNISSLPSRRIVALGQAVLWSRVVNFSVPSPKWIEEVLRRSGASLIDVGDQDRLVTPHSFSGLTEHASRIRSLLMSLPRRSWGSFDEYWQETMPVLEAFSSRVMSSRESSMDTTTFKILTKPLFKGDAPHLRSFSIEGCPVDFTLPIFRKLTKLHALNQLERIFIRGEVAVNIERNASSPGVEIRNAIGMLYPGTPRQVTLDHLSVLDLCRASISARSDLLEHLNSPPLSKYTSSCHRTGFVPDLTTLLPVVRTELSLRPHDITTHPKYVAIIHLSAKCGLDPQRMPWNKRFRFLPSQDTRRGFPSALKACYLCSCAQLSQQILHSQLGHLSPTYVLNLNTEILASHFLPFHA